MSKEEKIIGEALISFDSIPEIRYLFCIDRSQQIENRGLVRVQWRDDQRRRVTSFLKPESINEYKQE
jgi:hypothetical protein